MAAKILLTRPQAQSEALAETLWRRGWITLIAPMLQFERLPAPTGFASSVEIACAIAFTSGNGVRAFADASPRRDRPVYAVGDATADTARAKGFGQVTSADGDAGALEALLKTASLSGPVLHARGEHGRGDLVSRLTEAEIDADEAILYAMRPASELPSEVARALSAEDIDAVVFYSPRTAKTFARLASEAGLAKLGSLRAIAISAATAQALLPLGLGRIDVALHPSGHAMLDAIGRGESGSS